jgi:PII-like signaling protein
MRIDGEALRVTVLIGESDRHGHQPLHTAIVEMLRAEGCAGATVSRGVEGFGASSRIHSTNVLRLSEDLPMTIVYVDTPERVERVLPRIEEMVSGGLVMVDDVRVHKYAHPERPGAETG